jgi:DNA-binding NarL/FixJ family response regulator
MRVLLADDQPLLREGLKKVVQRVLPKADFVEAGEFAAALAVAGGGAPVGLIIADLFLPGMNGVSGLNRLRAAYPDVPVIVLSDILRKRDIEAAQSGGIAATLPKSMTVDSLADAIGRVLTGRTVDAAAPAAAPAPLTAEDSRLARLTRRERDVLWLLADGHPNRAIAQRLALREVTVKAHLRQVFKKLGVSNRTQAAAFALRIRSAT